MASKYEGLDAVALNAHIASLLRRRQELDRKIRQLRNQRSRVLNGNIVGEQRSGTQDREAVPTVELRPYVEHGVMEFGSTELARRANVSQRTIQKILNAETKFTTLRIADPLLIASGYTRVLGTEVRIVPNPQFRQEPDNTDSCG